MKSILNAPMIADPLGLYDCGGGFNGVAAAIVRTPEIARALPTIGIAHNLGGVPYLGVGAISIPGLH